MTKGICASVEGEEGGGVACTEGHCGRRLAQRYPSGLPYEEQCLWAVEAIVQMRLLMPHLHPNDKDKSEKQIHIGCRLRHPSVHDSKEQHWRLRGESGVRTQSRVASRIGDDGNGVHSVNSWLS